MGTHPIFESDFDCLTDLLKMLLTLLIFCLNGSLAWWTTNTAQTCFMKFTGGYQNPRVTCPEAFGCTLAKFGIQSVGVTRLKDGYNADDLDYCVNLSCECPPRPKRWTKDPETKEWVKTFF